ncbi:GH1 family beta-glucosidase [Lentzea sp. BCCO 10_0061]|uniref:Beta-glucosidase n=1 Tax=Lentzea sokolovensis TaxID=3095429 RepID=A0ABU4UYB2_9PSEU|nr:GH1 family beta-glucosidase [Lentzea sp. BCCO 10_0061]MDX8144092.1 GH1 family beta-glucosidase [Lentzea sp. BCCO 10_0061]
MSDFLWGVSTSAFQIEGAFTAGGRGPSVWDEFSPVHENQDASVACDHYNRWREDVALMTQLGVNAYRFSIAWPRIQPSGKGPVNAEGLDFYDRLVDALVDVGIAPVVTLYHWDTPLELEAEGGWLNRDIADRFADYTALVADRLADRVKMWIPINEPAMVTLQGYAIGEHAPGKALLFDALPTAHHLNLAHGRAVEVLRSHNAQAVGTANNHTPAWPVGPNDVAAAEAYSEIHNWIYADPMLSGRYPDAVAELLPIADGDLATIHQPLDFYGVNYYNPTRLKAPSEGNPLPFELAEIDEYPLTGFGWPIVPAGLTEMINALRERYPDLPPVYVTESGCSFPDEIADADRVSYLDGHLKAAQAADVAGYFVWSLLDNFEWEAGYSQRFGLVQVDYETQRRTPRDSFHWYRKVISGE